MNRKKKNADIQDGHVTYPTLKYFINKSNNSMITLTNKKSFTCTLKKQKCIFQHPSAPEKKGKRIQAT